MITTSAEYKTAIKADTEEAKFEAEFGFVPPGAVEGSSVAGSTQADISRLSQVNDEVHGIGAKYATCEPDRWLLDGTYDLVDTDDATQEVGFWSDALCGADGVFSPAPYIDYTMDAAYDMIGIMVWFDDRVDEYATSVTVSYYNASNALLASETFANEDSVALFNFTQNGVKWFRVQINSWSVGSRHAKMPTILPGQIYHLGKDMLSFHFYEVIQPFETSVALPEYTIRFDNSAKKFDIVNPEGLIAFLRQKMKIATKISLNTSAGYEDISTGDFYLYSWPENTQEDTASFTCRPSMAFATNYYVKPGDGTQTVAQAAAIIFAGISENHTIETELQSIVVNQNIGKKVPIINAMGMLAVACCGYWKIDRDGAYHLKKWNPSVASSTIDYDNAWEKPSIKQNGLITSVNVKYYTYGSIDENLNDHDNIVSTSSDGKQVDIDCPFIPSEARSNIVATAALSYYALRLDYEQKYRGDPSIECGDTVSVENDYGTSGVVALEHTIEFDQNGMSGEIKGAGV